MPLRKLALLLCLLAPISLPAHASETPAERAANQAANAELAAAPLHGNLPDYSLTPAALARAQHISAVRVRVHILATVWSILQLVLLLAFGLIARMRDTAARAGATLATRPRAARWLQGLVFLTLFLLATQILSLPLSVYGHHFAVVNGFSIQRWPSWFADLAKRFLLTLALGWPLTMLLFLVIRKAPRRWWLILWPIAVAVMFLGVYGAPVFYDPRFYDFKPLQQTNPELVAQLQRVVAKGHVDIPPERMFLMKASAKTTTINAYVTGFGASKRLVLWDTLLAKATPDEVLFIFGHESGHYVLGHIVLGSALGIGGLFIALYAGYVFAGWALRRHGAAWRIPAQDDLGTLPVLLLAFTLLTTVSEPISNAISRHMEHAADIYGQEAVHGIVRDPQLVGKAAMAVLGENYLEEPNSPRWQELWMDNHPATGRRAAFAAHYDPWAPGLEPKYLKP